MRILTNLTVHEIMDDDFPLRYVPKIPSPGAYASFPGLLLRSKQSDSIIHACLHV